MNSRNSGNQISFLVDIAFSRSCNSIELEAWKQERTISGDVSWSRQSHSVTFSSDCLLMNVMFEGKSSCCSPILSRSVPVVCDKSGSFIALALLSGPLPRIEVMSREKKPSLGPSVVTAWVVSYVCMFSSPRLFAEMKLSSLGSLFSSFTVTNRVTMCYCCDALTRLGICLTMVWKLRL